MSFSMHLKFSGGDLSVTGDSEYPGHTNEIPILSYSWGGTNKADLHASNTASTGNTAQIGDVQIVKNADSATAALFNGMTKGLRANDAYIYVTNSIDFYVAHLSNVAVISVSNTASAGADHVAEEVWLHFSKVEIDFTPQDDKGKAKGGAKTFTYDAKAPKKSA